MISASFLLDSAFALSVSAFTRKTSACFLSDSFVCLAASLFSSSALKSKSSSYRILIFGSISIFSIAVASIPLAFTFATITSEILMCSPSWARRSIVLVSKLTSDDLHNVYRYHVPGIHVIEEPITNLFFTSGKTLVMFSFVSSLYVRATTYLYNLEKASGKENVTSWSRFSH